MSSIKQLASQTAVYGLSSIVGRLLNYFLVPLHTYVFSEHQYGIVTEMYAYVAFLVIFLTYGMETAYFRYVNLPGNEPAKVYSTTLISVLTTSAIFISVCFAFSVPIANWLEYPRNAEYVTWFAIIVGLDAVTSIPLAKLRQENKAMKFAVANYANIIINILLNLFFLGYCRSAYENGNHNWIVQHLYNPEIGVGYVFISNLAASIFKFVILIPEMGGIFKGLSSSLLKQMLWFGFPLLIGGMAGIINEMFDRAIYKRMLIGDLGEETTMAQLGVYGAVYKISIIITLFIQAFRYAADPFFFSQVKNVDAKEKYAKVMNYFVMVCAVIFLGVMMYLDIIRYFIDRDYWVGLHVVPVLLFANIFLGIYYNQSIWYKLTNKTKYGAWIAIAGAILTIILNVIWIPVYGYTGCAWATLICYVFMMLVSFILGHKHYPVPYNFVKLFLYLGFAFGFYYVSTFFQSESMAQNLGINSLIFLTYVAMLWFIEKPKFSKNENQNN
ncbi:MAG: polysaccharide biosynthesis C-terminal domain-containing protein [Bacteroidota bacterium]